MSWNRSGWSLLRARGLLVIAAFAVIAATFGWHLWKGENGGGFGSSSADAPTASPHSPLPTLPRGRWNLAPPSRDERPAELSERETAAPSTSDTSADDAARVLSLPYAAATRYRGGAEGGVVIHDPARASAGVNLYVSGDAPEARLVDLEGREQHRWRYPFERAFPQKEPTIETPFFRRAQLDRAGNLYAIYQGGGLIVLDHTSRLLRKIDLATFNDFSLAADGTLHLLIKEAKRLNEIRAEGPVLEDSVVVLDPRGREVQRISLLTALLDSPFAALFEPHSPQPKKADILHANTIEVLDGTGAARVPWLAAGNLLVSLREIDTIGVVDPRTRRFVWAQRGPWDGQHQPTVLPSGKILLFDNRPRERFSRVLEFDPRVGEITWLYPSNPKITFTSPEAGSAQRLPNGNTLVTESERGRAFEITEAGEIVWEFHNPHRAGPRNELVATLFEVVRYPESFIARSLRPLNPSRSQSGSSRAESAPR